MKNYTLELERVLWAISKAQRWDTVKVGCNCLQKMREMIEQNETEVAYINGRTAESCSTSISTPITNDDNLK